MKSLRSRGIAALLAKGLVGGLLSSAVLTQPAVASAVPDGSMASVPSQRLDSPVPQAAEPTSTRAPAVSWPQRAHKGIDLTSSNPGRISVVSVRGAKPQAGAGSKTPSRVSGGPADRGPTKVDVQVLDRAQVEEAGGLGLGVRVARKDGGVTAGPVDITIDYSGFAHAYGGDFASRLRLIRLPACAATTPHATQCKGGTYVDPADVHNDPSSGTLTATVEAAPQVEQISGMAPIAQPAVYALTSGSSSDKGDYRASTLSPTGKWDVSLGSGAFTYSVPIDVPKPPMGEAPDLALSYNSQAVDGRTSATNNQASWVGMGWDLNVGYIERRYKNCSQDGHPTFGDLCWDSPNSEKDAKGANYVINLNGVTSELVQDNTGTGAFHLKDDPGWRVQKLNGGYGSDNTDEFWVVTEQDGTRHYFGWGRTERLNNDNEHEKTNSVLTVPVIGDDAGEPCFSSFPNPCKQAWRWNLDRVVTPNEVENAYFYKKEQNFYRSVAAADKARSYDAGSYLERIDYGWSSQLPGAQLPAQVDFQHVNRCVEHMAEKDPLNEATPDCPTIDAKPESYPDVPVDLICDGPEDGESCRGKTYHPTFFLRGMLWDINVKVRDNNTAAWDTVRQYQMKYALMNPEGSVGDQLWLDYIQRRGYSGDDIDMPTINFNGEWQDNKVGDGGMNFRRINKVFTDTGSTVAVTYGHATDEGGTVSRQCDAAHLPSESSNAYECFWQKWQPEGSETEKTGWFKKFVVKQVVVDPGDLSEGNPAMTTTYEYDGAPGWRYTADPMIPDKDESWSEWRGYGKVLVTTGAGSNKHSTYHWLYRGLDGDRTSKTDPAATRSVKVKDSEDVESTDYAWLAGKTLETSVRDEAGKSQKREWHKYWSHNTAQYTGLPDARFVRESEVRTLDKVHDSTDADLSTWREHIVQNEYEDTEAASTTFGLPMRVDDWGETGVSDNHCTEYGRAYNTSELDGTGTQRWMVAQDDERHYSVSCTAQAEDQAAGNDTLHQDKRTVTFFDGATSFTENDAKLTDGNPTQTRIYTDQTAYRSARNDYDPAGRVIKAWDGKDKLTTTAYQPATSWPVSGVTTTGPDPDGSGAGTSLISTVYPSRFFGEPWKTVDANGNTTRVVYDAVGRISQVFRPTESANYPDGNPSLRFSYTIPVAPSETGVPNVATGAALRVASETLQSGSTYVKSVAYLDGLGRTREVQEPAPSGTGRIVTVTRYDSSGNVAGTSGAFYNSGTAGSGPVNPAVADIPSYNDLQVDWAGRTTLAQIQAKGVAQAAGKTVNRYGGSDLVQVFPATGSPSDTYADVYGQTERVVEHQGAESYTTRYEYTRSAKLKYIHDSLGNTTHYAYNWAGDRVLAEDPDTGATTTGYNANGEVETVTGPSGTLTHTYDDANRLISTKQGSTTLTQKTYDSAPGGKGQPATSTTYAGGKAYVQKMTGYDIRGRLKGKQLVIPDDGSGLNGTYTFGYGYDTADHLTSVAYPAVGKLPAETVTTGYSGQGRLTSLTGTLGTYLADTGYDDRGRLLSRSLGNSSSGTQVTRTFGYEDTNGTGWLKNVITNTLVGGAAKKVQDDTFTRDAAGQITAARENTANQQQCYVYDDLDRLTDAWTIASTTCGTAPKSDFTGPDPYQTKYSYDRIGNIQAVTDTTATGSKTRDYTYPGYSADEQTYTPDQPRPHAVTKAGSDSFGYNDAGQMTSRTVDGVASSLEWNAQNRLSKVTQKKSTGDEVSTYVYDAEGNTLLRTSKAEAVLYVEGHELHKAGTALTVTRHYTANGTEIATRTADASSSANGTLTWLLSDSQASTQLTITMAGVVTRRRYTPFGKQRGGNLPASTDRGFLGKPEDDSTGLSMLGARMYDAALGRFLSGDELTTPYKPQNLSAYTYSMNNPIMFSDPSGMDALSDFEKAIEKERDRAFREALRQAEELKSYYVALQQGFGAAGRGESRGSFNVGAGKDRGVIMMRFFIHTKRAMLGMLLGDNRSWSTDPTALFRMNLFWNTKTGQVTFTIAPSHKPGHTYNKLAKARFGLQDTPPTMIPANPFKLDAFPGDTLGGNNILDRNHVSSEELDLGVHGVNSLAPFFAVDNEVTIKAKGDSVTVTRNGDAYPDMEVVQYRKNQAPRVIATDLMASTNGLDSMPSPWQTTRNRTWTDGSCTAGC